MNKIRQTAFFAFTLGLLVSDWKWVALAFFLFFGGLYLWSSFRSIPTAMELWGTNEPETTYTPLKYPEYRKYEIKTDRLVDMDGSVSPVQMVLDELVEAGFNLEQEISYFDNPVTHTRMFTQQILECTCRQSPMGRWVVGVDCKLHGVGHGLA